MDLWSKKVLIKSSPYTIGEVLFESAIAGTYSVDLAANGNYEVYVIGGGAGGATTLNQNSSLIELTGGGSGSGFVGVVKLLQGTHIINIGEGGKAMQGYRSTNYAGGNSSISDNVITYGGKSVATGTVGKGGDLPTVNVTIVSTTLNVTGNNGENDVTFEDYTEYTTIHGGESVYGGYGAGGNTGSGSPQDGIDGYVKIIYVGG